MSLSDWEVSSRAELASYFTARLSSPASRGLFYIPQRILSVYKIHFGPAHPSAHGVCKLAISCSGEVVSRASITLGLLHRGSEVMIALRQRGQSLGYLDRLDYVAMLSYESSFSECLDCVLSLVAEYTRGMSSRLSSLLSTALNHELGLGCHAGDLGALLSLLWLFEDRELLYGLLASITGCRVHGGGLHMALGGYMKLNK
jgi:NADH-quinone oxidoreductase subunit D